MMSAPLIVFDMDGTLVDSSIVLVNAINYVRERLYLPPMPREQILRGINDPTIDPAKYFYKIRAFAPEHERWFQEYYSRHHDTQIALYEGVDPMLRALKARGVRLALATNAYRNSTLEALEHLQIADRFDAVVCGDDVARPKPAPDMLLHLLKTTRTAPENALFVGDGPRDRDAARAAGIAYIMVEWGFSDHAEDTETVHSVAVLQERIERWLKKREEEGTPVTSDAP
jgi:phosphoglycolate phosphatase